MGVTLLAPYRHAAPASGVTFTLLTANASTSNISTYGSGVIASITPGANKLILAIIGATDGGGAPVAPTITGNGLTWVQEELSQSGLLGLYVLRAMGASPSAGVPSVDFAGSAQDGMCWAFVEVGGVVTTGTDGADAVRQSVPATPATATGITVTLASFGSASNATFGCFYHSANEVTTPGGGFTELADVGHASPNRALQVQGRADNDTTVDASWASSVLGFGIGLELVAA